MNNVAAETLALVHITRSLGGCSMLLAVRAVADSTDGEARDWATSMDAVAFAAGFDAARKASGDLVIEAADQGAWTMRAATHEAFARGMAAAA